MVCEAGKDGAEIGFGVDAVELCRFNERVDGGGTFAASIGACEEPVLATKCDATDRALGGIVVDFECAIAGMSAVQRPRV